MRKKLEYILLLTLSQAMSYLKYLSKINLVSFSKTSALVNNFNLNLLMQAQITVYRNFTGFYHFTKYMVKNTLPSPSGEDVL